MKQRNTVFHGPKSEGEKVSLLKGLPYSLRRRGSPMRSYRISYSGVPRPYLLSRLTLRW